jgi:hypothetical protein
LSQSCSCFIVSGVNRTHIVSTKIWENIDTLLSTEMDRTEFLKICGIAVLGVVGVIGILKALADAQSKPLPQSPNAASYGRRPYGGRPLDE